MRNNINVAAPGDKSYKVPEHSPGYYAQGGLIPGSSIVKRASAKPALQKREGTTTVQKTLSTMTYAQKVALEDERYEREQVLLLNVRCFVVPALCARALISYSIHRTAHQRWADLYPAGKKELDSI